MKKRFLFVSMLSLLSLLFSVDMALATVIDVFDIRGSAPVDMPQLGTLLSYDLYFGLDSPVYLTQGAPLNGITKLNTNNALIDMLQRTFAYTSDDRSGSTPIAEDIGFYEINKIIGVVVLNTSIDVTSLTWEISPIPDRSEYKINSLYADSFISSDGKVADMDIQILADVTPVPEPSSFILLALGALGICARKKLKVG